MNTIISKRSTPHIYTKSKIDPSSGSIVKLYSILVNGGAGVAGGADFLSGKKQDNFTLVTPEGVATIVDDETLEKLMAIKQLLVGYLVVVIEQSVLFLCPAGLAPASHPVKPVGMQRVA